MAQFLPLLLLVSSAALQDAYQGTRFLERDELRPLGGDSEPRVEAVVAEAGSQQSVSSPTQKLSVVLDQTLVIWRFMLLSSMVLTVATLVSVFHEKWSHYVLPSQEGAKLQVLVVLALLLLCPACRTAVFQTGSRIYFLFAVRNFLEAWLILLVFCTLPHMVQELTAGVNVVQDLCLPGATLQQGKGLQSLRTDVRHCVCRMGLLLGLRPVLQICREVAQICGVLEPFWASVALGVTSLVLLAFVALVPRPQTRAPCLGVTPATWGLQSVVAGIVVVAQVQDIYFVYQQHSENIGQVYAAVFLAHEVSCATVLAGFLLLSDPLVELVRYQTIVEEVPWVEKLTPFYWPYALDIFLPRQTAVPRLQSLPDPAALSATSHHEQDVVRSIWWSVLVDTFAGRVRSNALTVVIVVPFLCQAFFDWADGEYSFSIAPSLEAYGFDADISDDIDSLCSVFLLYLVCMLLWFKAGVCLMGNNTVLSKHFLWLTFAISAKTTVDNLGRTLGLKSVDSENEHEMLILLRQWGMFFLAELGIIGMVLCLHLLYDDLVNESQERGERNSRIYTRVMLETLPPGAGRAHEVHAKRLQRSSMQVPTVLWLATVTLVPVLLSCTFVAMYFGTNVLLRLRLGQVYLQAFHHPFTEGESFNAFTMFDNDFDDILTAREVMLPDLLTVLGKGGLQGPLSDLWTIGQQENVTNGSSSASSSRSALGFQGMTTSQWHTFLQDMYWVHSVATAIEEGDPIKGAEVLMILDKNDDGVLDKGEMKLGELSLAFQTLSPAQANLLTPWLPRAWAAADQDSDDTLSEEELATFLISVKQKVLLQESSVHDAVLSLILPSALPSVSLLSSGIAETTAPSSGSDVDNLSGSDPYNTVSGYAGNGRNRRESCGPAVSLERPLLAGASDTEEALKLFVVALGVISPALGAKGAALLHHELAQFPLVTHTTATPSGKAELAARLDSLVSELRIDLEAEGTRAHALLEDVAAGATPKVVDAAGLSGALALVNPALVTPAARALQHTNQSPEAILQVLSSVLLIYVGDFNDDGVTDQDDVADIARYTLDGAGCTSFLQRSARVRRSVRSVLMQGNPASTVNASSVNETSASTSESVKLVVSMVGERLRTVNLWYSEVVLHISALVALGFGIWVAAAPFHAQRQLFEQMQRGDYSFLGHSQLPFLGTYLLFSASFPGVLFSTVLFGVITVFIFMFLLLHILVIPTTYEILWTYKSVILISVVSIIINQTLSRLVVATWCVKDGEVVKPRLFSLISFVALLINFGLGWLLVFTRILFLLPFLWYKFHLLSTSMLNEGDVSWDSGYGSFLSMVRQNYEVSNPIRRSFLQAIAPAAAGLRGPAPSKDVDEIRARRLRVRNRFRLATLLHNSPSLQAGRRF